MSSPPVAESPNELVSIEGFHAIAWLMTAICVVVYSIRAYIRLSCFKRLLVEDWLMLVSLLMLVASAVLAQLFLVDLYHLTDAGNGSYIPGPTFLQDTQNGLRAFGSASLLWYIGIWIIKINFLMFFYRLGNKITSYLIFWWIVLVTVVACFIAEISIMQFDCMFGDIMDIIATCSTYPVLKKTHDFFIASCILDIFTDVLIICFPISILWRTRMNLRQKLYMSGIFSLVGFTIAVTVVRGSIFGGVYKSIDSNKRQEMNTTWIWFWFTMEYSVSFIIACLVSFRGLFAQASKKSNQESEARKRQAMPPSRHSIGFAARMRRLHDTIQDTCKTLEGTRSDDDLLLPRPPSPSIGLDFTHGSGDTHWTSLSKSKASQASQDHSRAESMTSHAVPLSVRSAPPSRNA